MQATQGYTKAEKEEIKANKEKELKELQEEREKDRELVNSPAFNKLPSIQELIKEIRLPNKIETEQEEDFVIRSFLRHGSVSKIIKELNERNKGLKFTDNDVKEFLMEYKDAIKKESEIIHKQTTRRMMKTKEGLTHELLDLAEFSVSLAKKYDDADDHTSAISAIKAAADIFYRNAKIEGILDEKTTININTQMDKLVQNVTSESSSFKEAVMKVVDKNKDDEDVILEADFEEVTDNA